MKLNKLSLSAIFLFLVNSGFSQITNQDTLDVEGEIFQRVEKEASYPGGVSEWRHFLEKNLDPAVPLDRGAPVGIYIVIIQFIVDKEGRVSEIKPLTKMDYGMEQEVVRVIRLSGLWEPAMQNQRPVKAYRKQPVTFQVQDDNFEITTQTPFVLYTHTDNELIVKVDKVKITDLQLTITGGSIRPASDGKFIARVNKPGRAVVKLYNSKKNKEIGAMSFEVRDAQ